MDFKRCMRTFALIEKEIGDDFCLLGRFQIIDITGTAGGDDLKPPEKPDVNILLALNGFRLREPLCETVSKSV